jgi:hypothetical protein
MRVDFQKPVTNLLAAKIQNTKKRAKHKFTQASPPAVEGIHRSIIIGVRVKAIMIRITATTGAVKSFFRWLNSPAALTTKRTRPPTAIAV